MRARAAAVPEAPAAEQSLLIELMDAGLPADFAEPARARGLVVFVHGSGSSRRSVRNRAVAHSLQAAGFATLLFDLLTPAEDRDYRNRFDIPRLTQRLLDVTRWARDGALPALPLGYFGASTGAAAALNAAAELGHAVAAVVSRGGRPDLALPNLARVASPTLLIVGGEDHEVLELNRRALRELRCEKHLGIVPGATHLFEEPGTLEQAADLAAGWFAAHTPPAS